MQQSGTEKASKPSSKWTAANYTGKFAFLLLVFMIGALVNFVNEKFAREGPRTDFATGKSERDKTKVTAKFKKIEKERNKGQAKRKSADEKTKICQTNPKMLKEQFAKSKNEKRM